jgi:hypothetical protein
MSYEALIAAQAKRLTKKRERGFMQYDWPSADQITERFDRMSWLDDYEALIAALYVPPAPERVELSHMEWAEGYRKWRRATSKSKYLPPVDDERIDKEIRLYAASMASRGLPIVDLWSPCFAENEI